MHLEKFRLDQIKWPPMDFSLLSHARYLVIRAIKQIVRFRGEDAPWKFWSFIKLRNGRQSAIIYLDRLTSGR